jgi:hypothetical protein
MGVRAASATASLHGPSFALPIGWSSDGEWIYAYEGKRAAARGVTTYLEETTTETKVLRVPRGGGPAQNMLDLPFEEVGGVTITPDGRKVVAAVYSSRSDVWIVDNFGAAR